MTDTLVPVGVTDNVLAEKVRLALRSAMCGRWGRYQAFTALDTLLARLTEAEAALIRCAEIAGEDGEAVEAARSRAMKVPSIEEFAIRAVEQLRQDYDHEDFGRAHAAEADRDRYREALEQYADPKNWAVERIEFTHPSLVWIGPGATDPVPDAVSIARAALSPAVLP